MIRGRPFFLSITRSRHAWHSIAAQHFISFNGLSPGRYTLKIKGNSGSGSRCINELSFDILGEAVFFKDRLVCRLVLMAAMMVAWLVARYRIRQIKKFQYLRTRIASDLHDDVGSSLVRITILADAINGVAYK